MGQKRESMAEHYMVLVVDDDIDHADILMRRLGAIETVAYETIHVFDLESAIDALKDPAIDIIFLDYHLDVKHTIANVEGI